MRNFDEVSVKSGKHFYRSEHALAWLPAFDQLIQSRRTVSIPLQGRIRSPLSLATAAREALTFFADEYAHDPQAHSGWQKYADLNKVAVVSPTKTGIQLNLAGHLGDKPVFTKRQQFIYSQPTRELHEAAA